MDDIAFCRNMLDLIWFFDYGPWREGVVSLRKTIFFNSDDRFMCWEGWLILNALVWRNVVIIIDTMEGVGGLGQADHDQQER